MVIKRTARFNRELRAVFDFIAKDSPNRARDFRDANRKTTNDKRQPSYVSRKSASFDDERVRDLIFKSYVIPYAIEDNAIYVLGIYGANKWQA